MSPYVWIGLIIQVVAVVLVLRQTRERWLSHVGVYFVVMAFIVNGLTEIAQATFPEYAFYRGLVTQDDIDNWIVIGSVAILIFAVAYTIVYSPAKSRESPHATDAQFPIEDLPPWLMMATITAVGVVGVSLRSQLEGGITYWVSGLTGELLIFALVLASLSYLVKNHGMNLLLVLVIQVSVAVLLSNRTAILVSSVLLVSALARYGIRPKRRELALFVLVGALLMATISVSRDVVGRDQLQSGLTDRVDGLFAGGQTILAGSGTQTILQDFVYRFDGNAFPAMVGAQFERGFGPVGSAPLQIDFFLMVPSFLYPDKLQSANFLRNEAAYIVVALGLPVDVPFLPGTLGVLYGSFGVLGLWAMTGLFGLLLAWIDIWIHRKQTLFGDLLGMALTYSALTMDVGLIWYFVNLRAILVLFVFLRLLNIVRSIAVMGTGKQGFNRLFTPDQVASRLDPHRNSKTPMPD